MSAAGRRKRKYGTTDPISLEEPGMIHKESEENLAAVVETFNLIEPVEESERRETVLGDLNEICQEWVQETTRKLGMSEQMASDSIAKLYTYGSYRLGVHNTGTDIDTLCVGPRHITHEMFFNDLCETLKEHDEIEEMTTVPAAYVPIAKFKFRGISIDLIYAKVALDIIHSDDFNIFDDNNLKAVDQCSVRSLNGARVTDMILSLVPRVDVFRDALRCIKLWAKRRAIYSNVIGYPGGVSYAILCARVCQLYPNANAAMIVANFFRLYFLWKWKTPVTLNHIIKDSPLGYPVWDPKTNYYDRMPIITPAYPAMNSTHNVSKSTLQVMKDEFKRADLLCMKIKNDEVVDVKTWETVLAESDFFLSHKTYLQVMCHSKSAEDQQIWMGWVESKLRKLVQFLEDTPYLKLRPYPYSVKCTDSDHPHCESFFIGVEYNPPKSTPENMKQVNITQRCKQFVSIVCLDNSSPQKNGMQIELKLLPARKLPEYVFKDARRPKVKKRRRKKPKTEIATKSEPTNNKHVETSADTLKRKRSDSSSSSSSSSENGAKAASENSSKPLKAEQPTERTEAHKEEEQEQEKQSEGNDDKHVENSADTLKRKRSDSSSSEDDPKTVTPKKPKTEHQTEKKEDVNESESEANDTKNMETSPGALKRKRKDSSSSDNEPETAAENSPKKTKIDHQTEKKEVVKESEVDATSDNGKMEEGSTNEHPTIEQNTDC